METKILVPELSAEKKAEIESTIEYQAISAFYRDRFAARSKEPYMKHIDEGIRILVMLGSSIQAIKAFCLHPLFQENASLRNMMTRELGLPTMSQYDPYVLVLVMEYRRAANAYLCKPHTDTWTVFDLRDYVGVLLPEVADMLYADKLQNKADFEIHHAETHERKAQLKKYFKTWVDYLTLPSNLGNKLWQSSELVEREIFSYKDQDDVFHVLCESKIY